MKHSQQNGLNPQYKKNYRKKTTKMHKNLPYHKKPNPIHPGSLKQQQKTKHKQIYEWILPGNEVAGNLDRRWLPRA